MNGPKRPITCAICAKASKPVPALAPKDWGAVWAEMSTSSLDLKSRNGNQELPWQRIGEDVRMASEVVWKCKASPRDRDRV